MTLPVIALAVVALLAVWVAYTYNFLIHARAKVLEAMSGVDVQLRLRHDLVPNLNAVVREYAAHEVEAMRAAAAGRSRAIAATGAAHIQEAENSLAASVRRLLALSESYPSLRASDEFTKFTAELTAVEDEIQSARELYNQNAEFYNTRAQRLPTLLVAGFLQPSSFAYFSLDAIEFDAARRPVGEFAA